MTKYVVHTRDDKQAFICEGMPQFQDLQRIWVLNKVTVLNRGAVIPLVFYTKLREGRIKPFEMMEVEALILSEGIFGFYYPL